jgi:hypothetical protein
MYRIIGADGKEYGPITAEQVRQWAAEGRANTQTKIRLEGSTEWKTLADFPELMAMPLGPVPGPAGAPPSFPMPGVMPASPMAMDEVNGPAIGLIVTAILGFIVQLLSLVANLGFSAMSAAQSQMPWSNMVSGTVSVIFSIIGMLVSGLILIGGLKMKKLENYTLAMTASIIAMIPCISPCCLIGLPIGIWALVILSKPEVKSSFH